MAIHPEMYPAKHGISPTAGTSSTTFNQFGAAVHLFSSRTVTVPGSQNICRLSLMIDENLVAWLGRKIAMHPY
ncbi:MAG: hypothetical protein ABIN89_13215 [Chitinophagaceae bacterium]